MIKKIINRETIAYLIFGVSTTAVNLVLYTILCLKIDYKIANLIALIIAKLYAYITNKYFVFKTGKIGFRNTVIEFVKFLIARGFTGIIDYFGLIFLVAILNVNKILAKYVIQLLIIVLNYFFGKFLVYTKKTNEKRANY